MALSTTRPTFCPMEKSLRPANVLKKRRSGWWTMSFISARKCRDGRLFHSDAHHPAD